MIIRKESIRTAIDTTLIFIVFVVFGIVAAGYFVRDSLQIICAAVTFAIALTAIISMAQKKIKPQDDAHIKSVLTQLIFTTEEKSFALIKGAVEKRYNVVDKKAFLLAANTAIFIYFKNEKLSQSTLSQMYALARSEAKKMLVLTVEPYQPACAYLMRSLPEPYITVLSGAGLYKFLRWLDALPSVEIELKKTKLNIKEFFIAALRPERAKGYFFTSFVLIFPSLVFSGSLYYIIFSFVCLTLGIIAKINIPERLCKKQSANIEL